MAWDDGLNVIADFVPDEKLKVGERIIDRVIKPQIMKDGKVVQVAQVVVRQGVEAPPPTVSPAVAPPVKAPPVVKALTDVKAYMQNRRKLDDEPSNIVYNAKQSRLTLKHGSDAEIQKEISRLSTLIPQIEKNPTEYIPRKGFWQRGDSIEKRISELKDIRKQLVDKSKAPPPVTPVPAVEAPPYEPTEIVVPEATKFPKKLPEVQDVTALSDAELKKLVSKGVTMFHGGLETTPIMDFDVEKFGEATGISEIYKTPAVFFTDEYGAAIRYVKGIVGLNLGDELEARAESGLREKWEAGEITEDEFYRLSDEALDEEIRQEAVKRRDSVHKYTVKMNNPLIITIPPFQETKKTAPEWLRENYAEDYLTYAKEKGHDGVIIRNIQDQFPVGGILEDVLKDMFGMPVEPMDQTMFAVFDPKNIVTAVKPPIGQIALPLGPVKQVKAEEPTGTATKGIRGTKFKLEHEDEIDDWPTISEEPEEYNKILKRLVKRLPFVKPGVLTEGLKWSFEREKEFRTSKETGRVFGQSVGMAVEWLKDDAPMDTPPHEFFHSYFRLLHNTPIVKLAINKFKNLPEVKDLLEQENIDTIEDAVEEFLAGYIGQMYVFRDMYKWEIASDYDLSVGIPAKVKAWFKRFWLTLKKMFKPTSLTGKDIIQIIFEEF